MQTSEYTSTSSTQHHYPTKPWNWHASIWHNLNLNVNLNANSDEHPKLKSDSTTNGAVNGHPPSPPHDPPPLSQLEEELPFVNQDQIPLGEILSRLVQDVYAELVTLADTLPSSSDAARKRMLADFVVKHKKQVVKLYALVKWAKDARHIQLCMNIVSFLLEVNKQFHDVTNALETIKNSLSAAKLRNHDLLTSLDVLTTGTYQRLPTGIKRTFIPKPQLTKDEIFQTLNDYDHIIRYRLIASEIIPIEMKRYHVAQGQAHFHVPSLFRVSLSLRGSEPRDAWFLVSVQFDIKIGDDTGVIEFPRVPTGITKQFIADEADTRLALYSFLEEPQSQIQSQTVQPLKELSADDDNDDDDDEEDKDKDNENKEGKEGKDNEKKEGKGKLRKEKTTAPAPAPAPAPASGPVPVAPTVSKLPPHVVDAPLIRLYNFLQILHYQAQRMRSLGWADFLRVGFARDRKSMSVSYWIRSAPATRPGQAPQTRGKIPLFGGTIVFGIEEMAGPGSGKNKIVGVGVGRTKMSHSRVFTQSQSQSQSQSQGQLSLGTPGPTTTLLGPSSSFIGSSSSIPDQDQAQMSPMSVSCGAVVQHPSGRSHVERVLHELSVVGKMRRRVVGGLTNSEKEEREKKKEKEKQEKEKEKEKEEKEKEKEKEEKEKEEKEKERETGSVMPSPRTRKDSIQTALTPRSRKDSASTPRPTVASAAAAVGSSSSLSLGLGFGNPQIQTQSSFMSSSGTQPQQPPLPPPPPPPPLPLSQLSDDIERLHISVKWTPEPGAFGFLTNPVEWVCKVDIDASDLDFQVLLMNILKRHSEAVLKVLKKQLVEGPHRNVFSEDEVVLGTEPDSTPTLSIHLCASEQMIVTIDPRTGKFSLRDMGDLASAGRGPRFAYFAERINENPVLMLSAVVTLRYNTIVENVEQKATALGLQTSRSKGLSRDEMAKFGSSAHAFLFIQLHHFRSHYLVLIVAEEEFRYALVSLKEAANVGIVYVDDIAWLDVKCVRGQLRIGVVLPEIAVAATNNNNNNNNNSNNNNSTEVLVGLKRKALDELGRDAREKSFDLKSPVIKELYAFCCARVAYKSVEWQLKTRGIPYTIVSSTPLPASVPMPVADGSTASFDMGQHHPYVTNSNTTVGVQNGGGGGQGQGQGQVTGKMDLVHSPLASSVPALCVQSKDILSGVPAAEAAMRNIRIVCINWWSTERKCQVVTCVQLKYVQPPVGVDKTSVATSVIRPSKSVMYDTRDAVVSFLSDDVESCVDEFLDGWARVSTIVVIAREVSQMAKAKKWDDVRLLSFDLQTVEFTYMTGYALSISCTHHQQATGGSYVFQFSKVLSSSTGTENATSSDESLTTSPSRRRARGVTLHDEAAFFLRSLLSNGRLAQSLTEIVGMLRDTLPMALELEKLKRGSERKRRSRDGDANNMNSDGPDHEMGIGVDAEELEFRGINVDVYAKSFSWYRVLFGDLRHALDFRLLTKQRVLIMDGSRSLHDPSSPPLSALPSLSRNKDKEKDVADSATSLTNPVDPYTVGALEPIPDFDKILGQVAQSERARAMAGGAGTGTGEGWAESLGPYGAALTDHGVVCSSNAAGKVGLAVFRKVFERLGGRREGVSQAQAGQVVDGIKSVKLESWTS